MTACASRRRTALLTLLASAVAAACTSAERVQTASFYEPTKRVTIPGSQISFEIPVAAELTKDSEQYPDFEVFRVKVGSQQLLGIYSGMAPRTPEGEKPRRLQIGGCLVPSFERADTKGRARDAYLLAGRTYHFFYAALTASDAAVADAMIASLRVGGPCART